jgi:archaellum component FlaC
MNTAPIWGPILAIVLAALWNQFSLSGFRKEMKDELGQVKADVDARLNKLDAKIEERFEKIDERFDKVDKRFDLVDAEMRFFHNVSGRVDELSKRVK